MGKNASIFTPTNSFFDDMFQTNTVIPIYQIDVSYIITMER